MFNYLIYGKNNMSMKKYRPLGDRDFEINLIKAVFFPTYEQAKSKFDELVEDNKDMNWQIRNHNTKKILDNYHGY
tara:strand:+ start:267 stop:491 length:225 start_codon:yes stop_codon:yes gene_type:complete